MEEHTKFRPKKPHFFKIILHDSDKQQLSIPFSFMYCMKGEKPDGEAILTSNNIPGKSWGVRLDGLRFEDGWKEFAKEHDLRFGDFLMFRYQLGMVFHVLVFDITGCQKEYPTTNGVTLQRGHNREKMKHLESSAATAQPNSVKEEPSFTTTIKRMNFSLCKMYIPAKFARPNGIAKRFAIITLRDEKRRSWQANLGYRKIDNQVYIGQKGWKQFLDANKLKLGDVCNFKLVSKGKKIILDVSISRTNGGLSNIGPTRNVEEGAPYFTATIQDYSTDYLTIPMQFARSHGLLKKLGMITIIDEIHKCWIADMKYNEFASYVRIRWPEFSEAKKLKSGDACTLKLLWKGENVVFKVSIVKGYKWGERKYKNVNGNKNSSHNQLLRNVGEEAPYFTATIQSHNRYSLVIPMHFARSNGLLKTRKVIVVDDKSGRRWKVSMRYYETASCVCILWRQFFEAKTVKLGDLCTLKLISNGEDVEFLVHILRPAT